MDTRGYENPFASSEEEIGQMDVAIEEEELIRETIRRLILSILISRKSQSKKTKFWPSLHRVHT